MDLEEENSKELWEWRGDEYYMQREISHCLWDDITQKEDDLLHMLGEQTPVKDCADIGYVMSEHGDKENKHVKESRESSQLKRRRMLQFNPSDTDIGIIDEHLASEFIKSKIGEDSLTEDQRHDNMQWIFGLSDSLEGLDQSSERWLTGCFNESEMHLSSDEMNVCSASENYGNATEDSNVAPQMKAGKLPVTVSMTPCNKFKGRKSYIRTPTNIASSVAYPFELIKPCGVQGDVTLKDINQRIHAPFSSKSKHMMDEDSSYCCPTSAFSGKPVVVKTKIRTEGGKGSITITRTRG